ncbi:hypothetical protein A3A93_03510 [Candidatus Roizmanbacteria bacterium RIFCSPLOWO2_01_FULL_38_12]|uniref:PD-(D/E)XK endonuclease-like domain-containing protein n=1 Tax=Candidatus Roizmanbacteria bacterium RIFCSPLOWO2_01_FULL_38_12 TaxID=1802061 RepID=A0A1F7IYR3_9BACT|nr:MAG: hypothetical protein A2861_03330 [Candidatus Roizmanbacteria bacterium RIFCSPHIGHO2_01_FULL_38_15]OGK48503.1 MAG: hypothetical protein A3A93_03510 [Candidatus Roizmanbacteria bacterium RIFCSPLOWO2_01_FULL_38_12]
MPLDKYNAIWISHSSISDFLQCRRAYFLKNIYRDPKTNHKIKIMSPPLALGAAVHNVIDEISMLPVAQRITMSLMDRFDSAWKNFEGKRGGFLNKDTESRFKEKGREMIHRVAKNPGPIVKKAVKIKGDLPHYWFSEEDNIILCGKIDWLEYLEDDDSVNIIDFKTSKYDESPESLQLPIYYLLVKNCQTRPVTGASYWYLQRNDEPTSVKLPDEYGSYEKILDIAREIKAARQLEKFECAQGGCQYCKPYEAILKGESEFVYVDSFNSDIHIIPQTSNEDSSEIL